MGARLHPRASQPALPSKPLSLPVWHLSVLPSYKLPRSLETIRSRLLSRGKSFLLPSRRVQLGRGGRKPFSPPPCGRARGEERRRQGGGGEHKPKKVEKACLARSHLTQVSKLIGRCMETPWALAPLPSSCSWVEPRSSAPPMDGPCIQLWSTTPFLGGL